MDFNSSFEEVSPFEEARLDLLHSYGILDTEPELAFDRITAMATRMFNCEFAIISLVDRDRVWYKSVQGLDIDEEARHGSFCENVIKPGHFDEITGDVFTVLDAKDAKKDSRFINHPLVAEDPCVRFYAGAPLVTEGGLRLGALAVMSHKPRAIKGFHAREKVDLTDLAATVMSELNLHKEKFEHQQQQQAGGGRRPSAEMNSCTSLVASFFGLCGLGAGGGAQPAGGGGEEAEGQQRDPERSAVAEQFEGAFEAGPATSPRAVGEEESGKEGGDAAIPARGVHQKHSAAKRRPSQVEKVVEHEREEEEQERAHRALRHHHHAPRPSSPKGDPSKQVSRSRATSAGEEAASGVENVEMKETGFIEPAEEQEEEEEFDFLEKLKSGEYFVRKHGRMGKPKERILKISEDASILSWMPAKKIVPTTENDPRYSHTIANVTEVRAAHDIDRATPTLLGTAVLRRSLRPENAPLALSVIWPHRTLDLEFRTAEECQEVLYGLRELLAEVAGLES